MGKRKAKWEELTRHEIEDAEANRFAIELLMPYDFVDRDLGPEPLDIESGPSIKDLAKKYRVSEQLMTMRVLEIMRDRGAV